MSKNRDVIRGTTPGDASGPNDGPKGLTSSGGSVDLGNSGAPWTDKFAVNPNLMGTADGDRVGKAASVPPSIGTQPAVPKPPRETRSARQDSASPNDYDAAA